MSAIEYVNISITRSSMPEGSLCRVDYAYLMQVDAADYSGGVTYAVSCELCGTHPLFDEELGNHLYDEHSVAAATPMPVVRSFLVPCTLLNERWGKDSIYVRVLVRSSTGKEFSAESPRVRDHF